MDVLALVGPMIKERYGQALAGGLIGFLLSWLFFGRHVRRDGAAQPPWPNPWAGPWPSDDPR
jgi:hypothetical protein